MAAKVSPGQGDAPRRLSEALKRFCRSIELCDDYLRGYYGLKLVSVPGNEDGMSRICRAFSNHERAKDHHAALERAAQVDAPVRV